MDKVWQTFRSNNNNKTLVFNIVTPIKCPIIGCYACFDYVSQCILRCFAITYSSNRLVIICLHRNYML